MKGAKVYEMKLALVQTKSSVAELSDVLSKTRKVGAMRSIYHKPQNAFSSTILG